MRSEINFKFQSNKQEMFCNKEWQICSAPETLSYKFGILNTEGGDDCAQSTIN